MPMNNFNTGRDITLNIIGFDGTIKNFALQTDFDAKQMTNKISIKGLDGVVRFLEIPDGWDGGFSFERQDALIDQYFNDLENAYYGGQNVQAATITETIQEVNGGISQYRYTGVMFKLDDAGTWHGDASIKMKISWCASRRFKIQ